MGRLRSRVSVTVVLVVKDLIHMVPLIVDFCLWWEDCLYVFSADCNRQQKEAHSGRGFELNAPITIRKVGRLRSRESVTVILVVKY